MTDRNPFETGAAEYDAWYETEFGFAVLASELACIRPLLPAPPAAVLEVGVGTGRFADELDIAIGVDPSVEMLTLAADRGIDVVRGMAEALPFADEAFEAVLFVTALEFVADAATALREAARVVGPNGTVVVGFLAAGGAWAVQYQRQAASGPSVFSSARFFALEELQALARDAGLAAGAVRSTLLTGPGERPRIEAVTGLVSHAGFVAAAFTVGE